MAEWEFVAAFFFGAGMGLVFSYFVLFPLIYRWVGPDDAT